MNKQRKELYIVGAWAIVLTVVLTLMCLQALQFKRTRRDIAALRSADVVDLVVYDHSSRYGTPRRVTDTAKIAGVLKSLQAGIRYHSSHDPHNDFERSVILEQQQLELRVYQRPGDEKAVVVSLSGGDVRCPNPAVWKKL